MASLMKCSSCNQELNFPEEILKNFTNCPLCGALMPKVGMEENVLSSIETELQKIVDDFGGLEIFSEENYSRFRKALMSLDDKFAEERDKLLIANIKHLPQKLYSVLEMLPKERQQQIESFSGELINFGLQQKLVEEVLSWLEQVMRITVAFEQKPIVEKRIGDKIVIKVPPDFVKNEYFDCEMETCIINESVWTASNLFLDRERFWDYHYKQINAINEFSGSIFRIPWFDAHLQFPDKGWRLPTIEDFKRLEKYIKSLGMNIGEALKSPKLWFGRGSKGKDLFGFAAYPAMKGENGLTKVSFWADRGNAIKTGRNDYSLVTLDADSDDFQYEDIVDFKEQMGCVRFVKDKEFFASEPESVVAETSQGDTQKEKDVQNTGMQESHPIDDQDIRHWKEEKFFKNVYSSKQFRDADLETKAEMRREAKEEAKLIKALRRDAGLGGGCYITTAICETSGKADDCHELTMMRKFRDEWLAKQPDGMYVINDYYETAPQIVSEINKRSDRNTIYSFLDRHFLKKCISFIEKDKMFDCKKCYMDMVLYCYKFLTNKVSK